MAEEELHQSSFALRQSKLLRFSWFEGMVIGAMLLVLTIASVDALEGRQVGQDNALEVAKMQGQQELMASRFIKE